MQPQLQQSNAGLCRAVLCCRPGVFAGLLQPVSQSLLGVMCSHASPAANGNANGCASSSSSQASLLSSSPVRSASSCGPPPGFANGNSPANGTLSGSNKSAQQQRQQHAQSQALQQQQRWGELRLPLQLGHPPADTAVFAPLMAALQELQVCSDPGHKKQ